MTSCEELIRPALESAFSDALIISENDGDCRVSIPFERSDGDMITLWILKRRDKYYITDEGETFGQLYLSNIDLNQERRSHRIKTIQERFNLDKAKEEVSVTASQDKLGIRILDIIQAVQSMSYLTYTRRQYTQTDFRADVGAYLTESGYRYDSNPEVTGTSENHRVDFSILGQNQPTYLEALHAETAPSAKSMAQRTMYKWVDIQHEIPDVKRLSVIDDESGEFGHDAERILRNYSDGLISWSQRNQLNTILTA